MIIQVSKFQLEAGWVHDGAEARTEVETPVGAGSNNLE